MSLESLGWNSFFAEAFQPFAAAGLVPARVSVQHRHRYEILGAAVPLVATCTGRLLQTAPSVGALPVVGDWVVLRIRPGEPCADIHGILPRRTAFSRRAAGEAGGEQVIAANLDTVLIVCALDRDFNLRRIERYLTAVRQSGADPVVVLNKADLHALRQLRRNAVSAIVPMEMNPAAP